MHAAVQPGQILLGKYRVEHMLGEGGMGVVIAARHIDLGQLFAIKLMLPAALADSDAIERFLREARAAARLRSEHVARVYDIGRLDNGAPYMVMEHLSGQDLKQILHARGPLPPQEAAMYVYQACEAVAEAHSLGIVHRDLKPANLFLTQRPDGTPCVKVLDFGISKELDPSQKVGPDLTKTGTIMGSPHYMSPEQMANIKRTDARSDIWSLGVILFELLTGTRPFVAEALMELLTMVVTMPPSRPTQFRPDLPPALEAVVLTCLEKPCARRFQSVRELMAALHPFITHDRVTIPAGVGTQIAPGGPIDLGAQTNKAWAGASGTGRARGNVGLAAGVVSMCIALLMGSGAWLAWRSGPRSNPTMAAEAGASTGLPEQPMFVPAATAVPANTVREVDLPKPAAEPPVTTAAPSASGLASAKPQPAVLKTKTPPPERANTSPRRTTSVGSGPSSTSKIPGFND